MFLRESQGLELGLELTGGAGARPYRGFGRAAAMPPAPVSRRERWQARAAAIDWVPDLGSAVGSREWWRGLATCAALCAAAWTIAPPLRPLAAPVPAPLVGDEWEAARATAIAPLGLGADTGRRMAATDLVRPLAETPERPIVDLTATLGEGDGFTAALARAGVGMRDAQDVAALVSGAVALGDIAPGTRLALTLGRRPDRSVARPLEKLSFRASFALDLAIARTDGRLAMTRQPIAIDRTPLRIQGLVGSSLYRSARAAGAPAQAVEDYLRALATRLSIGRDVGAADTFDLVIGRERAATGEVRLGDLLFAGLDQGGKATRLVRWTEDGRLDWYDAAGQIRHQGAMGMPVAGHITSSFGWRFHPILGFTRMHQGIDIGARYGTPITAALDGTVSYAGWHGGHGNFVQLSHAGGIGTGYGHMSRIAVRPGEHVQRGEVIGYVGATGLATGPHLHWEVTKGGRYVNPATIAYASVSSLPDATMRAFKARVASLLAVKPGR